MAKRAVRASLGGDAARANVWEAERRELPFTALPRLLASHGACVLFVHFVSFSSCNNRSGRWHQRTKATCPRSHSLAWTWNPGLSGLQSCALSAGSHCSWGQDLLEIDKEWAQLCL